MFSNTPPKHCISGALFRFLFDNNFTTSNSFQGLSKGDDCDNDDDNDDDDGSDNDKNEKEQ